MPVASQVNQVPIPATTQPILPSVLPPSPGLQDGMSIAPYNNEGVIETCELTLSHVVTSTPDQIKPNELVANPAQLVCLTHDFPSMMNSPWIEI